MCLWPVCSFALSGVNKEEAETCVNKPISRGSIKLLGINGLKCLHQSLEWGKKICNKDDFCLFHLLTVLRFSSTGTK